MMIRNLLVICVLLLLAAPALARSGASMGGGFRSAPARAAPARSAPSPVRAAPARSATWHFESRPAPPPIYTHQVHVVHAPAPVVVRRSVYILHAPPVFTYPVYTGTERHAHFAPTMNWTDGFAVPSYDDPAALGPPGDDGCAAARTTRSGLATFVFLATFLIAALAVSRQQS